MDKTKQEVIELQPHELMSGLVSVIRETSEQIGYYKMKEMAGNHLDIVINETINRNNEKHKDKLTDTEIRALAGKIYTKIMLRSSIQALSVLSEYYSQAKKMSRQELLSEQHKPNRLSRFVKATGICRPTNTAAHAIVSGCHSEAVAAREILANFNIRIDDPDNGVFLPRNKAYIPHPKMPDACNHAELHTKRYYMNVTTILSTATSELECRLALRLIGKKLKDGTLEY